jgi:hypothetical protein
MSRRHLEPVLCGEEEDKKTPLNNVPRRVMSRPGAYFYRNENQIHNHPRIWGKTKILIIIEMVDKSRRPNGATGDPAPPCTSGALSVDVVIIHLSSTKRAVHYDPEG